MFSDRHQKNLKAIGGLGDASAAVDRLAGEHRKIGLLIYNRVCNLLGAAPNLGKSIILALGNARGCGPSENFIKLFRRAILGVLPEVQLPTQDPHCEVEVDAELNYTDGFVQPQTSMSKRLRGSFLVPPWGLPSSLATLGFSHQ
eukprot:6465565-Amphidinium_carterae.1